MVPTQFNSHKLTTALKVVPHIRELALIVGAYFAYMYTRNLVVSDFEATALGNAHKIVDLERSLGFFWEPHWQAWALDSAHALVLFFNWAYIITFFPIVIIAGLILYFANRGRYRYFRNVVLLTYIFALIGFMLFPLAPPRMLAEHFVDTIKVFGPPLYSNREAANYYNAYAAMPSVHFAWTLILGILFLQCRSRWLKAFGIIYPTMTLFAITITANHYLLDAAGGLVVMAASFATIELGLRRRLFLPRVWSYISALRDRYQPRFRKMAGGMKASYEGVSPVSWLLGRNVSHHPPTRRGRHRDPPG